MKAGPSHLRCINGANLGVEWMMTGELESKIDTDWNDFRSGCISNPLEVMEPLTILSAVGTGCR